MPRTGAMRAFFDIPSVEDLGDNEQLEAGGARSSMSSASWNADRALSLALRVLNFASASEILRLRHAVYSGHDLMSASVMLRGTSEENDCRTHTSTATRPTSSMNLCRVI